MSVTLADAQTLAVPPQLPNSAQDHLPFFLLPILLIAAAFLPVIVGFIRNRFFHQILAIIFCVLSIIVAIFGSTLALLGGMFLIPIASGFWFVGLIFGVAASIDAMAEGRVKRARAKSERIAQSAKGIGSTENLDTSSRRHESRFHNQWFEITTVRL